jgi:bacillopeptidase F (M6 metalloprotease family)
VVPAPLVLRTDQAITNDFSQNADPFTIYTQGGTGADGWVVRDGKLRIGQGPNYKNNLETEAALFLDLANKPAAKLSFDAEVHSEKGYDFFKVQVFADGKSNDLIAPMSGDSPETHYSFDLSAYAGKKIEIRFTFTSDPGVNSTGPTLDNLLLQ